MANEEQLSILRQGVKAWNEWRKENISASIDMSRADLKGTDLAEADFHKALFVEADLVGANLSWVNFWGADLSKAKLNNANLTRVDLSRANLNQVNFCGAKLWVVNLRDADLSQSELKNARIYETDLSYAILTASIFSQARIESVTFGNLDLSKVIGLDQVNHYGPSILGIDTLARSRGKIPELFLQGCGLSDADIEYSKLYNPELMNHERSRILYRIYDLQASRAIQISHLFISYSHEDSQFVDKVGMRLSENGVRYWRDTYDMKAGRMEKQIDRAIRQNPTVLLVLSQNSLDSDWVEHEVRTARELEKDLGRDVLCPVALDDSWKGSSWPKRVMEQIMEYNILDFSDWRDDRRFDEMFRRLIDGLELFYKR